MNSLTIDKATLARLLDVADLGLENGDLVQLANLALDWWKPLRIEAANGGFVLLGLAELPQDDKAEICEQVNPLAYLLAFAKKAGSSFGRELAQRWGMA